MKYYNTPQMSKQKTLYNKVSKYNKKLDCTQMKLRTELESTLNERGVDLRSDSVLCSSYINGKTNLTLDQVVQRMCEMKYLYECCDMKNIRTQTYNDYVANGYIKDYEGTITQQAEKIALKTYSDGVYPKVFPWEKSDNENQVDNKLKDENEDNEDEDDYIEDMYGIPLNYPFIPIFLLINLLFIYQNTKNYFKV